MSYLIKRVDEIRLALLNATASGRLSIVSTRVLLLKVPKRYDLCD